MLRGDGNPGSDNPPRDVGGNPIMGYEERMEARDDYVAERAREIYGGDPEDMQGCCDELEIAQDKLDRIEAMVNDCWERGIPKLSSTLASRIRGILA